MKVTIKLSDELLKQLKVLAGEQQTTIEESITQIVEEKFDVENRGKAGTRAA